MTFIARPLLPILLAAMLCASAAASRVWANEQPASEEKKAPEAEPRLPGIKSVPIKKPAAARVKPLEIDSVKGIETYCGAIAGSAQNTRLAWQAERIKSLEGELIIKIAELEAKAADVRRWVQKREELLGKANESLTAIYSKMKPEAASAQLQAMDDETAAALLLKLKPAVASALLAEMDAARAARLSDFLTGAAAKQEGKKS